jgi:hypothetical protein
MEIPSITGGASGSNSSTGDVFIPASMFQFPEYPAALAASTKNSANMALSPLMIALIVAGLVIYKKVG